jgi:hypothetical protein
MLIDIDLYELIKEKLDKIHNEEKEIIRSIGMAVMTYVEENKTRLPHMALARAESKLIPYGNDGLIWREKDSYLPWIWHYDGNVYKYEPILISIYGKMSQIGPFQSHLKLFETIPLSRPKRI